MSESFWVAFFWRAVGGFLNGNAPLVKSYLAKITDKSNRKLPRRSISLSLSRARALRLLIIYGRVFSRVCRWISRSLDCRSQRFLYNQLQLGPWWADRSHPRRISIRACAEVPGTGAVRSRAIQSMVALSSLRWIACGSRDPQGPFGIWPYFLPCLTAAIVCKDHRRSRRCWP